MGVTMSSNPFASAIEGRAWSPSTPRAYFKLTLQLRDSMDLNVSRLRERSMKAARETFGLESYRNWRRTHPGGAYQLKCIGHRAFPRAVLLSPCSRRGVDEINLSDPEAPESLRKVWDLGHPKLLRVIHGRHAAYFSALPIATGFQNDTFQGKSLDIEELSVQRLIKVAKSGLERVALTTERNGETTAIAHIQHVEGSSQHRSIVEQLPKTRLGSYRHWLCFEYDGPSDEDEGGAQLEMLRSKEALEVAAHLAAAGRRIPVFSDGSKVGRFEPPTHDLLKKLEHGQLTSCDELAETSLVSTALKSAPLLGLMQEDRLLSFFVPTPGAEVITLHEARPLRESAQRGIIPTQALNKDNPRKAPGDENKTAKQSESIAPRAEGVITIDSSRLDKLLRLEENVESRFGSLGLELLSAKPGAPPSIESELAMHEAYERATMDSRDRIFGLLGIGGFINTKKLRATGDLLNNLRESGAIIVTVEGEPRAMLRPFFYVYRVDDWVTVSTLVQGGAKLVERARQGQQVALVGGKGKNARPVALFTPIDSITRRAFPSRPKK